MYKSQPILLELLHICEFIAMFVGILKLKELKKSYWKWFVYYLIYILIYEISTVIAKYVLNVKMATYLSFIQIPLEFIFLYWLYALKSLKNKLLFYTFSLLFVASIFLEKQFAQNYFTFQSLNKTIGTLLLLILVVLEFIKQIKSDTILNFKSDKMFYINIGVILFYIGNMPFMGWYMYILKYPEIWNNYYRYFLISNCIMYLLFSASFIWGKPK